MIGLIISGHGNFATGLRSSLKLIAGSPSNVEYIDFEENDSTEDLKKKYYTALQNLNNCDSILALSDLAGGSPFKTLVEVKTEIEKPMEVIGGTNLPMLLEISMMKDIIDDLNSLSESIIEIGRNAVIKFELIEGGVPIKKVNIGNMHMAEGKRQVAGSVAVDDKDVEAFRKLKELGVELEIRRVPTEPAESIDKLFK